MFKSSNIIHFWVFVICLHVYLSLGALEQLCPKRCECYQIKQSDVITRVKCIENKWTEFDLRNNTEFNTHLHIQHLDLSRNRIEQLYSVFLSIPGLKKLNLSENKLRIIDVGAFNNLTDLQTLDLSVNYLQAVTKEMFSPLSSLQRLKLRKNKLINIESNLIPSLPVLTVIDLSENPWHCDCNMIWFPDWARTTPVKLTSPPKCESPSDLVGLQLKRLTLECTEGSDPELSPSNNQVVFAGDSLALRCRSGGGVERVRWAWGGEDPKARFSEVNVTDFTLPEHGWVESWLRIKSLEPEHSGDWICQQIDGNNRSAVVSVHVLSSSTLYCPEVVSSDNKGVYYWPRTIVGHSVEMPCATERGGVDNGLATYICDKYGVWGNLNTSLCPYISETTNILQQFSLENLTSSKDNSLLAKAKMLRNFTDILADPVDVVFLSRTLAMYAPYVVDGGDLGAALVDIAAGLFRVKRTLLFKAQITDKACSKLISTLEIIAKEAPNFRYYGPSLALERFDRVRDSFSGMTCIWKRSPLSGSLEFRCATILETSGQEIQTAVELPRTIFDHLHPGSHQLIVSMFANGQFFLDVSEAGGHVLSNVVGVTIDGADVANLSDPIVVMTELTSKAVSHPVWWDISLNDGRGGWSPDVCHSSHISGNLVIFHCDRLGYYSLLQRESYSDRRFHTAFGPAAMYSGSCGLLVCLVIAVITYVLSQGGLQMSRRAKHAVVNIWLALCLLCFIFSFGVFATEEVKTCEIIGLVLHYFSLSALLWMTVAANHMYKRLSRGSIDRTSVEMPGGVPVHKPILGLYLVGWGIGLIVCGISGAVHLRDYANPSFCFLGASPALSAVLVPAAILVGVLSIFYCLTLCAIRNNDVNGQLSEGTQGTEHVDLELLEDGATCPERQSARSVATDSEDVEDVEHTPMIQLKAHVIVLVLFLMAWCSAALLVTSLAHPIIPKQEILGSIFYCSISFCLGAFILYFYCVARSDVRARWGIWRRRRCCRSRSISDAQASLPLQPAPPTLLSNGPPSVNSGVTCPSSSSHRTKAVTELNNSERAESSNDKPANNANLVAMHRQLYRSNNSMPTYHEVSGQDWADAFYNPRQSIVARKFFKKQRRNRRNELGLRRRGDGGGTSEGEASHAFRTWRPSAESAVFLSSDMENNSEKIGPSLFGFGSKINNTNIHVGQCVRRRDSQSPKDPNVLSDAEGEKSSGKILLSRMVIGAEGEASGPSSPLSRLDEEPIAPDCRSIELQCSLGDSSDFPDGDDSFSQKIDGLRLHSDQSCTDSPVSPPQYVTVLDPKYGVVKVTMNDYYQESHRLSLASHTGEPVTDFQRRSLPSTPEELDERDDLHCNANRVNSSNEKSQERLNDISREGGETLFNSNGGTRSGNPMNTRLPPSNPPTNSAHFLPRKFEVISIPKHCIVHKKPPKRRSLPSSPEGRTRDPRLSLPSSPDARDGVSPQSSIRQSPRFNIPPPPIEDFNSSYSLNCKNLNGADVSEQWEKPPSPCQLERWQECRAPVERIRPKSEAFCEKLSSAESVCSIDEVKKETSV